MLGTERAPAIKIEMAFASQLCKCMDIFIRNVSGYRRAFVGAPSLAENPDGHRIYIKRKSLYEIFSENREIYV